MAQKLDENAMMRKAIESLSYDEYKAITDDVMPNLINNNAIMRDLIANAYSNGMTTAEIRRELSIKAIAAYITAKMIVARENARV